MTHKFADAQLALRRALRFFAMGTAGHCSLVPITIVAAGIGPGGFIQGLQQP